MPRCRPLIAVVLLLVAGALAAGCGDDGGGGPGEGAGAGDGRGTTAAAPPGAPPASGPALRPVGDPPPGLREQVEFQEGAGPGCEFEAQPGAAPGIAFSGLHPGSRDLEEEPGGAATRIGDEFTICFPGFDPSRAVSVTLRGAGVTRTLRTVPAEVAAPALPTAFVGEEPPGRYAIEARQGSLRASGGFVLRPSDARTLRVVAPPYRLPEPGEDVKVIGAGFAPGERTRLAVYAKEPGGAPGQGLVATFRSAPVVQADEHGVFVYTITSQRRDAGCYVVSLPGVAREARYLQFQNRRFCLLEPEGG
jgi:hypothetical protein